MFCFFFCFFCVLFLYFFFFFFSSRRRHTRCLSDWSSDVCSSDPPCSASAGCCAKDMVADVTHVTSTATVRNVCILSTLNRAGAKTLPPPRCRDRKSVV